MIVGAIILVAISTSNVSLGKAVRSSQRGAAGMSDA